MRARTLITAFVLFTVFVPVSVSAATTTIDKNTTLQAGEYFYDNLIIASSSTLTLQGNPEASSTFKGVAIHANNLTVEQGSTISAYGQGYGWYAGLGAPVYDRAGASYGGIGEGNTATSTYGSALDPQDLGSGSFFSGGGAIKLIISGALVNDGIITADGKTTGSGGSINVSTKILSGSGSFTARGGNLTGYPGYFVLPGGGGRIMIRYASSTFSGRADASGACGFITYPYKDCGGDGTVGFLDTTTDTLTLPGPWRFESNDSPFTFSSIDVAGTVLVDDGVSLTTGSFKAEKGAAISVGQGVHIVAPNVLFNDGSQMTSLQGKPLSLFIDGSLALASGASINLNGKGYGYEQGPGAPAAYRAGASYGGVGWGNTATSTYGDADNPTDLGSGARYPGGGALSLTVSGTVTNDGTVSANSQWTGSGGSILVHAHSIEGSGLFSADGGILDLASLTQPGGGGRIALYSNTATSSFAGTIEANGGCAWSYGTRYCAGNGTVVLKSTAPKISNVLFLPGIEGSRLFDEGIKKEVWLPSNDSVADDLRLNSDGTSVNTNITASGIIDQTGLSQGYHVVYKDMLQEMQDWQSKYHIIATSTPYDWRLGYDTLLINGRRLPNGHISYTQTPEIGHDPYLIETLKQLASTSQTGKVTIIAHSNGGLLAKALMQKLGAATTAALIDNIILVASPQLGTPDAIGAILHGYGAGIFGAISDKKARDLAQNMPMTYLLLPSSQYFTYIDDPVVTISSSTLPSWASQYGSVIHWAQGLYNFMADSAHTRAAPAYSDLVNPQIVNSNLIKQAQIAHASLDIWTPPAGVQLYTIAGWGNETPASINYTQLPVRTCAQYTSGSTCAYYKNVMSTTTEPSVVIDGDGTVVTSSALWADGANSTRYWVDLNGYNGWLEHHSTIADEMFGTHHDNILNVPELQNLLSSIITASTTTSLPQHISTSVPAYTGDMARLHFILHSPLTLGFTDVQGNYTGATATTTVFNIPGIDYRRFGEVQWLSVPKSMAGTVVMHGTGTGSFALDIEEQQGNTVVATTTFAAMPSATSTIATLAIDPSIDPTASSTLVVDYRGDGTTDTTYHAIQGATVLPDLTPPEAIIGFSTTTQQVEVTGVDDTSTTTVASTATSTTISDASGNWLTIDLAENQNRARPIAFDFNTHLPTLSAWGTLPLGNQDFSQHFDNLNSWKLNKIPFGPGTATFAIRSLSYSTGTTTNVATTLRYFWNTDRSGKYTTFISSVKTSTDHIIAIYVPHLDKTFIVSSTLKDDGDDLSTKASFLLLRKKINTYNGLYIPSVRTKEGRTLINLNQK